MLAITERFSNRDFERHRRGLTLAQIAVLRWRQAQPGNPQAIEAERAAVAFGRRLGVRP